jgi:hypothetical protein
LQFIERHIVLWQTQLLKVPAGTVCRRMYELGELVARLSFCPSVKKTDLQSRLSGVEFVTGAPSILDSLPVGADKLTGPSCQERRISMICLS